MLQRQEKHLHLLVMRQCIKKIVCFIAVALGVCINLSGCSSAKLSEAQIDEVEIRVSHYVSGTFEKAFKDKESADKYVDFFDALELQEKSKDIIVSELDGAGWDYITFKSQGKTVKQYVIYGDECICEEESLMNEILEIDATTEVGSREFLQKLDAHKWYVLSDEESIEWRAYKASLKQ